MQYTIVETPLLRCMHDLITHKGGCQYRWLMTAQARAAVVGERKAAPLVEVPPADMEGLQQDIDRLDAASADLASRVEAANAAREKERWVATRGFHVHHCRT